MNFWRIGVVLPEKVFIFDRSQEAGSHFTDRIILLVEAEKEAIACAVAAYHFSIRSVIDFSACRFSIEKIKHSDEIEAARLKNLIFKGYSTPDELDKDDASLKALRADGIEARRFATLEFQLAFPRERDHLMKYHSQEVAECA